MNILDEMTAAYGGKLPEKVFIPKTLWPDHFQLLATSQVLELIKSYTQGKGPAHRQTIHKWKQRGWLNEQQRGRPPGKRNHGRGAWTSYFFKGEVLEVLYRLENNMITK